MENYGFAKINTEDAKVAVKRARALYQHTKKLQHKLRQEAQREWDKGGSWWKTLLGREKSVISGHRSTYSIFDVRTVLEVLADTGLVELDEVDVIYYDQFLNHNKGISALTQLTQSDAGFIYCNPELCHIVNFYCNNDKVAEYLQDVEGYDENN